MPRITPPSKPKTAKTDKPKSSSKSMPKAEMIAAAKGKPGKGRKA